MVDALWRQPGPPHSVNQMERKSINQLNPWRRVRNCLPSILRVPPPIAIAYHLIKTWALGELS